MTAGTEQQFAIVAEGFVFHIGGNGIGARFLFRKRDVIIHPILLCISGSLFVYQSLEQGTMFGRNREMHIHLTVLIGSIQCSFYQVLFQRRAATVFILMELKQSFGQSTIVQSGPFE